MGKRAYGSDTIQRTREEDPAGYGVGGTGDWTQRPFFSTTLSAEQALLTEPRLLGQGREPPKPSLDVINANGDIVVPVDQRHFGFWLKMLLGAPATTDNGDGTFDHVYSSGGATLPSFARELQHTQTQVYGLATGIKVNTLGLEWRRSGKTQATLGCIAQNEALSGAADAGTNVAAIAYDAFSPFQGSIKQGGAALGNVVEARLTYSNGAEAVENIRSDGLIDDVDPGPVEVSGELVIRFNNLTTINNASAGTPIDLELGWVDAVSGHSLLFAVHEVYLPRPRIPVEGPRGIQARYAFQASLNTVAAASLTATLVNDVETY